MRLRLPQIAVYWAPASADRFGRVVYTDPVELNCRWEDGVTNAIDPQGNDVFSRAKVFLKDVVRATGLLMLGTLEEDVQESGFPVDPKADPRVFEIISVDSVPNLKATQTLVTAFVK